MIRRIVHCPAPSMPVRPQEIGRHVVVVDASYRDGWAGLAAIADGHSVLVDEVVASAGSSDAEARAIRRAVDEVRRLGWPRGVVRGDTDGAIVLFRKHYGGQVPEGWMVERVSRRHVGQAHRVARRARREWAL